MDKIWLLNRQNWHNGNTLRAVFQALNVQFQASRWVLCLLVAAASSMQREAGDFLAERETKHCDR